MTERKDPLARDNVLERLRRDLMGPDSENEVTEDRPSDLYLTGILWPRKTRMGGEDAERLGAGDENGNEGGEEDEVPVSNSMRPSVAGLSFAVGGEATINIQLDMALYENIGEKKPKWKRRQISFPLEAVSCVSRSRINVDEAPNGVQIDITSQPWREKNGWLVTVTLINGAVPAEKSREAIEETTLFQTRLKISPAKNSFLMPRPDQRFVLDEDDHVAELLYRNAHEFAVGHTCSATWPDDAKETADWVATEWMPTATVPSISANGDKEFEKLEQGNNPLDPEWLSQADDAELGLSLRRLGGAYRTWISSQEDEIQNFSSDRLKETARNNIRQCQAVADRLENGADIISKNPILAAAFRFANKVMLTQYTWAEKKKLKWRPFQMAFLLLSAPSSVYEDNPYRQTMDLLWFPTGGGKTEAYLGLIAFVCFARRLRSKGEWTGVGAVMRYTLRLLTTQQFSRATAMILACEALRRGQIPARDSIADLGKTPFSIGLWVGGDATPNTLHEAGNTLHSDSGTTAKQIQDCPCCGKKLKWSAVRENNRTTALNVRCVNKECPLHSSTDSLPIHTVDEIIYAYKPTLLIGTVDKFAQIVRNDKCGPLFGAGGEAPPDLIIQDELHLISGPLGTLAGLYEVGIDRLFWRNGKPPKVIGSTATIRRANSQVKDLFNRDLCQFPPPAIDATNSGFAVIDTEKEGRLYAAVTTAGRSAKFTLQAVSGSVLQTGVAGLSDRDRDPYWTLVTYFNSLRELGGALVLMQDDVPDAVKLYGRRRNEENFREAKTIEELTSRRSQKEVRDMLDGMKIPARKLGAMDVILATNMLSVGVDIPRLGVMLMNGQPKGIAEYIQATSRVGRRYPGLVIALLNNSKARDRSRFETFRTWHSTLYRDVEATSVTPFASRARDRALHAALIAAARHLIPGLDQSPKLDNSQQEQLEGIIAVLVERAKNIDSAETAVEQEIRKFVSDWKRRNAKYWWNDSDPGRSLLISSEAHATLRAQDLDSRGAIPTPNSMRNVEAGVPFRWAERLSRSRGTK